MRLNPDYREAHFGMGVVLRKLGKREEAEAEFRQVEAMQEISTRIQAAKQSNDSGYDLWSHGKTDEALAAFQKASEMDPSLAEARYNIGVLLGQKGQLAEARSEFFQAIRLRPDFSRAYYNLGIVQTRLGENQAARQAFEKARELDPALLDVPSGFLDAPQPHAP